MRYFRKLQIHSIYRLQILNDKYIADTQYRTYIFLSQVRTRYTCPIFTLYISTIGLAGLGIDKN